MEETGAMGATTTGKAIHTVNNEKIPFGRNGNKSTGRIMTFFNTLGKQLYLKRGL